MTFIWIVIGILVAVLVYASSNARPAIAQGYTVTGGPKDAIQIRNYAPVVVVEVEVSGRQKEARQTGIAMIADYVFGHNGENKEVSLNHASGETTPSISPPVVLQTGPEQWTIRFALPSQYTVDTLPAPANEHLKLVAMPPRRYAVTRLSGSVNVANLQRHSDKLIEFAKKKNLQPVGEAMLADYNPPSGTFSMRHRRDVMLEISA